MSATPPMDRLMQAMRKNTLVRIYEEFDRDFSDVHLKDLAVEEIGPGREIVIQGRRVMNFGSDSFLGLDRDPRVIEAVRRGLDRWGTHNGASRAFSSVATNVEAEERLAAWMGTEATLIYPSATLANMGAIPGLVGRGDVVVLDEFAHNSMQEAARLALAGGARVATFAHNNPDDLGRALDDLQPYRAAIVCIDGVYSMSGVVPPMAELDRAAQARGAVLYIDDAHGTGVLGRNGRGTALDALGSYENAFVVGSLSKAFSCAGGFVACSKTFQKLLKMRSNTYVFGGPVVPAYFDAIIQVVEILESDEYPAIRGRLGQRVAQLAAGLKELDLVVTGDVTPIVSVFVGDEADTLRAGRFLFDAGFYVQSVLFPAVPYHGGMIRVQCNANHTAEAVDGLLSAFAALRDVVPTPRRSEREASKRRAG